MLDDLTEEERLYLQEREKLPQASNAGLALLFQYTDEVRIKEGGVHGTKALTDNVVLTISDKPGIGLLKELMALNEEERGFYCMCLGSYAVELYTKNELNTTIGFHHGTSIRYDGWHGDIALSRSEELLQFLAERGLKEPLEKFEEDNERANKDALQMQQWLDKAPRCFGVHWDKIEHGSTSGIAFIAEELNKEIPGFQEQVIKLLQLYGCSERLWSAYPVYEEIPFTLLQRLSLQQITELYLGSDRNYKTRRGLGRLLNHHENRKNNFLKYIPVEVVDDLIHCFTYFEDEYGVERMKRLHRKIS
jgi:hypothetical protein